MWRQDLKHSFLRATWNHNTPPVGYGHIQERHHSKSQAQTETSGIINEGSPAFPLPAVTVRQIYDPTHLYKVLTNLFTHKIRTATWKTGLSYIH